MPAVLIRLVDSLSTIMEEIRSPEQRQVLVRQAEMILLNAKESVPDPNDLADIQTRYERTISRAALDRRADESTVGTG
jgi:uncharacterized membrane protein